MLPPWLRNPKHGHSPHNPLWRQMCTGVEGTTLCLEIPLQCPSPPPPPPGRPLHAKGGDYKGGGVGLRARQGRRHAPHFTPFSLYCIPSSRTLGPTLGGPYLTTWAHNLARACHLHHVIHNTAFCRLKVAGQGCAVLLFLLVAHNTLGVTQTDPALNAYAVPARTAAAQSRAMLRAYKPHDAFPRQSLALDPMQKATYFPAENRDAGGHSILHGIVVGPVWCRLVHSAVCLFQRWKK